MPTLQNKIDICKVRYDKTWNKHKENGIKQEFEIL